MSSLSAIPNNLQTSFQAGVSILRRHPLATRFGVFTGVVLLREVVKNALSWKSLFFCGGVVALYYGYKLGKYYLVELPPIRARLRQEEARTQQLMTIREAQETVYGAFTVLDQELQNIPPQDVN